MDLCSPILQRFSITTVRVNLQTVTTITGYFALTRNSERPHTAIPPLAAAHRGGRKQDDQEVAHRPICDHALRRYRIRPERSQPRQSARTAVPAEEFCRRGRC